MKKCGGLLTNILNIIVWYLPVRGLALYVTTKEGLKTGMSIIVQPRWKKVEYSKSQIERAGQIIKDDAATADQLDGAVTIIDNWRAAHAYPMHVFYMNLRRIVTGRSDVVVAERLKRIDSIIGKLKREPHMNLWKMQDLGGCRLIAPTIEDVNVLSERFSSSRIRHKFLRKYDYIEEPKNSGYRSLHLVYKYYSDKKDDYNNNMIIELQFRTHLQHIWATSVETMGLFVGQNIKAGHGDEDVARFFVLVSSLFALEEQKPIVPNTVQDADALISELKEIIKRRNYLDVLSAVRIAVERYGSGQGYHLLTLDYNSKKLRIDSFKPSQADEANEAYARIEETRDKSKIDVVLVRVSSFQTLKTAFPNYFSDIGTFVNKVRSYLRN